MASNKLNKISVFISLILRHKPEAINIKLDEYGYANVDELLKGMKAAGKEISFKELCDIVDTDEKQRYSFNEDKTKIKANQGHSINIKLELIECMPPDVLYHGTVKKNLDSILEKGLCKMKRHHVHLSDNLDTAKQVAGRRKSSEPVILKIDTKAMVKDGYKFLKSTNGVWHIIHVSPKYIKILK